MSVLPDFSGRVALVTGGSRGIGRAVVQALAAAGADVAVNYRERADAAETAVAAAQACGRRAMPAMLALVELTRPGPFAARTHELGDFFGVRVGGTLVAMTGERMKMDGYTEVTAVCTHPDHRGRGYARALLAHVARGVLARGEVACLHVFSDNAAAIALYLRSGFVIRKRMHLTVLGRRAG